MTTRLARCPRLVVFDCDGVLVDSEGPSNRAVAEEVGKLGWSMGQAESMRLFVGFTLEQIAPVVEAHLGREVPDGWVEKVRQRLMRVLEEEVETVPGVTAALAALDGLGLPYRVASNSSRREMRVKFARTGLSALLPLAHSADDVVHGKPAPDVYLAAAAAAGVPPQACLAIEDSVPGAMAAVAAGMACLGLDREGDGEALRAVGAAIIHDLAELPPLLHDVMQRAA